MIRQKLLSNLRYSKKLVNEIILLGAINLTNLVPKCAAQILAPRDTSVVEHLIKALDPRLVNPLITSVNDNSEFADSIATALRLITNMDLGRSFEAWQKWWKIAKNIGPLNTYTSLHLKKSFRKPYIKGKMIIIEIWKDIRKNNKMVEPVVVEPVRIDSICIAFSEELIATRPEEVGTIVWLYWSWEKVGAYLGSLGSAYVNLCEVTIIDKSKSAIIWQKIFRGSDPPYFKKGLGSASGNRPVSEIINFLSRIPVRSNHR